MATSSSKDIQKSKEQLKKEKQQRKMEARHKAKEKKEAEKTALEVKKEDYAPCSSNVNFFEQFKYSKETSASEVMQLHPCLSKFQHVYSSQKPDCKNDLTIKLLSTLKEFVSSYSGDSHELNDKVTQYISLLSTVRPLTVSMMNCVKIIKQQIFREEINKADFVDELIKDRLEGAMDTISMHAIKQFQPNDVVLIFQSSPLLLSILQKAQKNFRVIFVQNESSKNMVKNIISLGIDCCLVSMTAVSFIMDTVSKVLLDADAILNNGYVLGQIGFSQISLIAHSANVPTIVCCETIKFCDKMMTDIFSDAKLVDLNFDSNHLNISFDITPPDFISVMITEVGMIPCTSAPAVLRMKAY